MDDATKKRIDALRAARADYAAEVEWHRFLLDAVCGTGGFRGNVGPTAISYLGWAAEAYARDATSSHVAPHSLDSRRTYLDQFPREDDKKFSKRIDVSYYVNYTGPLGEIFLAYVNKEEMNRDEVGEGALSEWMEDVDGKGNDWDMQQRTVVRARAALLGWCPVMLDKPVAPSGEEMSVARAAELGIKLRSIPLFPCNVLDWMQSEDGTVTAVKIRTDHWVRDDLLSPAKREEHYAMWYADRVVRQVITVDHEGKESLGQEDEVKHGFGVVPFVSFRAANPAEDTEIRGPSIIGDIATVNKRIYNLDSEGDDHIRGQVFAVLAIPVEDPSLPLGELILGNDNSIKIWQESRQQLHYAAPPASVAATIEKRREVLVRELYRIARLEYAKPTGVTTSGIARAYEFEQTNRKLGDIAASYARCEQRALRLAERLLGKSDSKVTVTPPADFSVEDMATEIDNVMSANELDLGTTASIEMKRRVVRRMLPNLPAETAVRVEQELNDQFAQIEADKALERQVSEAAAQAALNGPKEPTGQPGDGVPGQGQAPGGVPSEA
jgi:hypothetical protein